MLSKEYRLMGLVDIDKDDWTLLNSSSLQPTTSCLLLELLLNGRKLELYAYRHSVVQYNHLNCFDAILSKKGINTILKLLRFSIIEHNL